MGDFTMPSLGADMEAGTIAQWLVKPGDEVHRGGIVAVVETEKSTMEVEIFESGVIDELLVHEGESVPVGTVLAHVTTRTAEAVTATPPPPPPSGPLPPPVVSPVVRRLAERSGVDLAVLSGSGLGGTVTRADVEKAAEPTGDEGARPEWAHGRAGPRSSPLARRLAAELGVDLSALRGSGPHGSVVERDVRLAVEVRPDETPPASVAPEDRQAAMRRAIGALMARSKREIPHYYLSTTIDLTAPAAWLEQTNLERPITGRLIMSVLLLKATSLAVKAVPEMNGFMGGGTFASSEAVHVGVAVSLRTGGVIAPAIHNVDQLTLDELMTGLKDLVGRARTGVLRTSEMSDPTITVTNLGDLGVEAVFGVIYPPQVALVGFGRVTERAWARDGMLGVHPCVTATLSADHRVSDGHRGGRFLAEIDRLLQEPGKL